MAYFPIFLSLRGKRAMVFGGGRIATRKAEMLLPFGCTVSVYAKEFKPGLLKGRYQLHACGLEESSVREALHSCRPVLAVAATDNRELNRLAGRLCREQGIPVNVADSKEESTFLFPALAMSGDTVIGVSTAGRAPFYARLLRKKAQALLPRDGDALLDALEERRAQVQEWLRELPEEEAERKIMELLESLEQTCSRPAVCGGGMRNGKGTGECGE